MGEALDEFQQVVVLECLHKTYRRLGFASAKTCATKLVDLAGGSEESAQDRSAWIQKAIEAINRKYVAPEIREELAAAAVQILAAKKDTVLELVAGDTPDSVAYLTAILDGFEGAAVARQYGRAPSVLGAIVANWANSAANTPKPPLEGAYQLVRRYKPVKNLDLPGAEGPPPNMVQAAVHEVLFVDETGRQPILITAEGNIYRGAAFLNHEGIYATLFQRVIAPHQINQRYLTLKLVTAQPQMLSGIHVKVGDTTARPVASDALFTRIPDDEEHRALYAELRGWAATPWRNDRNEQIAPTSAIRDYLSATPPQDADDPDDPRWERVTLVDDLPVLKALTTVNTDTGFVHIRESIRTLSPEQLVGIARAYKPRVFRHSQIARSGRPVGASSGDK